MTKKLLIHILTVAGAGILQATLAPHLTLLHATPDLLAVMLAFLAITIGRNGSMSYGFLGGAITGLLSGDVGLHMLAGTAAGFSAGFFHIPEGSHATPAQKKGKFIKATAAAAITGSIIMVLGTNPLGFTPAWRLFVITPLSLVMSMIPALFAIPLFSKTAFSD